MTSDGPSKQGDPEETQLCGVRSGVKHLEHDLRLQTLLVEYHQHQEMLDRRQDTVITIASIGYTTAIALTALIATERLQIPAVGYWFAPMALVLLFVLVIQSLHSMVIRSYYIRDLETEIRRLSGVGLFGFESIQVRALFSVKTGMPAMILTYIVIYLVAAAIYFALVVLGFQGLKSPHPESPSGPTEWIVSPTTQEITGILGLSMINPSQMWFITTSVAIGVIMTYMTVPLLKGFREPYERYSGKLPESSFVEADLRRFRNFHLTHWALLPRPGDFAGKLTNFLASVVISILVISTSSAPQSYEWFLGLVPTVHGKLLLEVFVLPLVIFFVIDILVKQDTYAWNEIRDIDQDCLHPYKKYRVLPRLGRSALPRAKVILGARFLLSISCTIWVTLNFSVPFLPGIIFSIYILQFVYDKWAKPKGGCVRLLLCALGYSLRWFPASFAVKLSMERTLGPGHGENLTPTVMVAITSIGVLYAVVFLEGYWWADAERAERRNESQLEIDTWFLTQGPAVRRTAAISMYPILFLIFTHNDLSTLGNTLFGFTASTAVGAISVIGTVYALGLRNANHIGSQLDQRVDSKRFKLNILLLTVIIASLLMSSSFVSIFHLNTEFVLWITFLLITLVQLLFESNQYEYLFMEFLPEQMRGWLSTLDRFIFEK